MRATEVNKRIETLGGVAIRQVGSHRRFRVTRETPKTKSWFTTVPQHKGDIPVGTLNAIEKDLTEPFGEGWLTG